MGTRLLIAIPTCHSYQGNPNTTNRTEEERRAACRETWLKDCPVDYRLFYGRGPHGEYLPDEVRLDCWDDYDHLSDKMREMCRWALRHDYTHLFRVDTDAYVYVDRLLKSGFEEHEYTGYTIDYPKHLESARYCSGAGWVMNRRAMEVVVEHYPESQADDFWTGKILHRNGFKCHRETRYLCGFEPHYIPLERLPQEHPYIVLHALTPEGIREVHARGHAGDKLGAPKKPMFEPDFSFWYGKPDPECLCDYCKYKLSLGPQ